MAATNIQFRGHCQCCGRLQAVTSNRMSKHGYTVEKTGMGYGWFRGVCSGHSFAPLQHDRQQADSIVASVRLQVVKLRQEADALEAGTKTLNMVEDPRVVSRRLRNEPATMVAWKELPSYYADQILASDVWNRRQRADAGEAFANDLEALANKVHGTCLLEVERVQPAAPILVGERRELNTASIPKTVAKVTRVDRARVYWVAEGELAGRRGWTGTQAWRKLTQVEG
jgi:hypothetical protein